MLELGKADENGAYPLRFSCDRDIDSGEIALATGYDLRVVQGLAASPDEQIFVNAAVALSAVEAGTTAVKAIWPGPKAEGQSVQLRCTVKADEHDWLVIKSVKFPSRFIIV